MRKKTFFLISISNLIITMFLLNSCNEDSSRARIAYQPRPVVTGLNSDVLKLLEDYLELSAPKAIAPKAGDFINQSITYNNWQFRQYDLEESAIKESFICRFRYKKAQLNQNINEIDSETFNLNTQIIPIEPEYISLPSSEARKAKCLKSINQLTHFLSPEVINIEENFKQIKNFISNKILDLINTCKNGGTYNLSRCESLKVNEMISDNNPFLIIKLNFQLTWNDGAQTKTQELQMEMAPNLLSFKPLAILSAKGITIAREKDLYTDINLTNYQITMSANE